MPAINLPKPRAGETWVRSQDPNDTQEYLMYAGSDHNGQPVYNPVRQSRIIAVDQRYIVPTIALYRATPDGKVEKTFVNRDELVEELIPGTPNYRTIKRKIDYAERFAEGWTTDPSGKAPVAKPVKA